MIAVVRLMALIHPLRHAVALDKSAQASKDGNRKGHPADLAYFLVVKRYAKDCGC